MQYDPTGAQYAHMTKIGTWLTKLKKIADYDAKFRMQQKQTHENTCALMILDNTNNTGPMPFASK